MPIVVTNIGTGTSVATATTTVVTVPAGGIPAGATICITCSEMAAFVAGGSVASTNNTPYLSVAHQSIGAGGTLANGFMQTFYFENASAETSGNSITYTRQGTTLQSAASAFYATGLLSSSSLDTAVTASVAVAGSSTSPLSGTVTSGVPSQAGNLFVASAFAGNNSASSSVTFSQATGGWAAPFTAVNTAAGNAHTALAGGNQVNAGTGALTFAPTWTIVKGTSAALQIIAFKAAASAVVQRRTSAHLGTRVGSRQIAA